VKSLKKVDMSTSNRNSSIGKLSEKVVRTSTNSSLENTAADPSIFKAKLKNKF
jgi:hypothetical protein